VNSLKKKSTVSGSMIQRRHKCCRNAWESYAFLLHSAHELPGNGDRSAASITLWQRSEWWWLM